MLTEADKRIVERDTQLPGLALLLDKNLLLAQLQTLPPFAGASDVEIRYLRYKPGNSCAAAIRIATPEGLMYYYAKALTEARFQQSWNKPSRQKLVQKGGRFAPLALAGHGVILLHPVHDRDIGHLDWLVSGQARRRILKACSLPECSDGLPQIEIVRYKPARRLVAKVIHLGRPVAVLRSATPDEFAKMLVGNAYGVSHGGVLLTGADGASCTLATQWQKGRSLCPEEGRLPSDDEVAQLGRKLARIHRAAYRHPTAYTTADEIQAVQRVYSTLRHILPEQAARFASLQKRTAAALADITEETALIHGDFSLDQVVSRESKSGETKLHILDWDRCAQGHPLLDLASFQARMELQVIEGVLPPEEGRRISDGLIQAYRRRKSADAKHLRAFTASALLRLAADPFRKRSPHWEQYTLQLLCRVREILEDETGRPSETPSDVSQDPALHTLLDTEAMQPLLRGAGILSESETAASATLLRYKPGRRALAEYLIRNGRATRRIIGKYRAKGLDKRSCRIQHQLWQSGFGRPSENGVAEVLGTLPQLNTWFQSRINGRTVGEMLHPDSPRLAFLGEAAADALTALHRSAAADALDLPFWTPDDEWRVLDAALARAQRNLPQLAGRIAAVSQQCAALTGRLNAEGGRPSETLHRDFYQDQILEAYGTPGRMVLLDLDLACRGDGALDAGNYLAHIQEFALRKYGGTEALKVHEDAFRRRFLEQNQKYAKTVEAYTTLTLARHIGISTLFSERAHTAGHLLALCEARLKRHLQYPTISPASQGTP